MKYIFLFVSLISFTVSGQDTTIINNLKAYQVHQNKLFSAKETSPLSEEDRKMFSGLDFFDINLKYRVTATLQRTPQASFFKMKTTTSRVSEERVYGVVTFVLEGKKHQLNVYQGKQLMKQKGYEDYLFLPFFDKTNAYTTYGGGRYIDLKIPEGNTIIIDFNKAYNPYCSYNENYSCPIVPNENSINIPIKAGVKAYKKH